MIISFSSFEKSRKLKLRDHWLSDLPQENDQFFRTSPPQPSAKMNNRSILWKIIKTTEFPHKCVVPQRFSN